MIPKTFKLSTAGAALAAGALSLAGTMANADQVILDDLIVDGSACIGQDCVNGESFGFDTIRIKENNLRIKAQDTSTTASFPTQDWELTFNESDNGGENKFSVTAVSPISSIPFTIEDGAGNNALYIDDGGEIGFGTDTPVVDLHVKSGNTPTLRLEQDGSSGFAAQTWDLAGNEANLFFRDVTNGSDLPFRIFPNAGTNALVIEGGSGQVGIGTNTPDGELEVETAGTNLSLFTSSDGGAVQIRLKSDSVDNRRFVAVDNSDVVKTQLAFDDAAIRLLGVNNNDLYASVDGSKLILGSTCIQFGGTGAGRFACTFSAGAAPSCAAAPSDCP